MTNQTKPKSPCDMMTLSPHSYAILFWPDAVAPVPVSSRLGAVTRAESSLTMAVKKAGKKVSLPQIHLHRSCFFFFECPERRLPKSS